MHAVFAPMLDGMQARLFNSQSSFLADLPDDGIAETLAWFNMSAGKNHTGIILIVPLLYQPAALIIRYPAHIHECYLFNHAPAPFESLHSL